MILTTRMIQGNLAYYLPKHTPLTEQQVNEQFEEWLLAFAENIIEVRENQIIKLLEDVKADLRKKLSEVSGDSQSETYWYSRIQQLDNYIALIKGED